MNWALAALCIAIAVYSYRRGLEQARQGDPTGFLVMCWTAPAFCILAAIGLVTS